MLNRILQISVVILIATAGGLTLVAITQALSSQFKRFWDNVVAKAKEIWNSVSEATKYFFALLAQYLEKKWSEIEPILNQKLGYVKKWLVSIFKVNNDVVVAFQDDLQETKLESVAITIGKIEDSNVQLPSLQNAIVTELVSASG